MTIKRILGLFFLIALISLFAIVYYPKTTEITSIEVNKDPIYLNQNSNGDFKEFNESDFGDKGNLHAIYVGPFLSENDIVTNMDLIKSISESNNGEVSRWKL